MNRVERGNIRDIFFRSSQTRVRILGESLMCGKIGTRRDSRNVLSQVLYNTRAEDSRRKTLSDSSRTRREERREVARNVKMGFVHEYLLVDVVIQERRTVP